MDLEEEESWLRHHLRRLRTLLRYAKIPGVETGLRELVADTEARLEMLESRQRQAEWREAAPGGEGA
jgi:hypothetical protein